MKTHWRLLLSPRGEPGAMNMALDEAILQNVAEKRSQPTLRLYAWEPATLSLGFAQPAGDVDLARLDLEGWGIVRRPTGGKAILHIDELTYSITSALDDPLLAGSLLDSYRKISQALLKALEHLHLPAAGERSYEDAHPKTNNNPVCFETPSNYEITSGGKKLVGSAQARKYGGMLQHGALPIRGDITRITRVLQYPDDFARQTAAENLNNHATNLELLLNLVLPWETVAEAMIKGFADSFGISFIESQPSQVEIDLANKLMNDKYLAADWTFRL